MKSFHDEKYGEIIDRLITIEKLLLLKQKQPEQVFLDNQEFLQVMNISQRTAQTWRDSGLIGFSMIGAKIYYKMTEIQDMLDKHYHREKI